MKEFEWDESKRLTNIEKHYLDFIDAIEVFTDINQIERIDQRQNYPEIRYQTIGKLEHKNILILIVWTYRESKKRIISARIAHSKERKVYYEKQNKLE